MMSPHRDRIFPLGTNQSDASRHARSRCRTQKGVFGLGVVLRALLPPSSSAFHHAMIPPPPSPLALQTFDSSTQASRRRPGRKQAAKAQEAKRTPKDRTHTERFCPTGTVPSCEILPVSGFQYSRVRTEPEAASSFARALLPTGS